LHLLLVFEYYGNPVGITEDQLKKYFKEKKGLYNDDILYLMLEACWDHGLINIGSEMIDEEPKIILLRPQPLGEPTLKELAEEKENSEKE
jgi:hypothetical protein